MFPFCSVDSVRRPPQDLGNEAAPVSSCGTELREVRVSGGRSYTGQVSGQQRMTDSTQSAGWWEPSDGG